jgi:hypothetical protein
VFDRGTCKLGAQALWAAAKTKQAATMTIATTTEIRVV